MSKKLTVKQKAVLNYQISFFKENHQLPTCSAISKKFGWKSSNAAFVYVKMLTKKGYLQRNDVGSYKFSSDIISSIISNDVD